MKQGAPRVVGASARKRQGSAVRRERPGRVKRGGSHRQLVAREGAFAYRGRWARWGELGLAGLPGTGCWSPQEGHGGGGSWAGCEAVAPWGLAP